MKLRRWWFPGLLLAAGLALWLLLAGPSDVLGFDPGKGGVALLVAVVWASLFVAQSLPRGELDRDASPGEWKAWIGVVFMGVAVAYFLARIEVFRGAGVPFNPEAARVGRNLVLLLVAWAVLSSVVASRWKGRVQEDERDREIARKAGGWGRAALIAAVIGIAVMLGFSPAEKLRWASHMMVANLLVFALMWGWLVEYAVTAVAYWRDRH